jgi:hypothetical protein
VNYVLNHRPADPRISAILTSLDFWIGDSNVIEEDKQKVKVVDRFKVCGNANK